VQATSKYSRLRAPRNQRYRTLKVVRFGGRPFVVLGRPKHRRPITLHDNPQLRAIRPTVGIYLRGSGP
jgi:hypothetical protein